MCILCALFNSPKRYKNSFHFIVKSIMNYSPEEIFTEESFKTLKNKNKNITKSMTNWDEK